MRKAAGHIPQAGDGRGDPRGRPHTGICLSCTPPEVIVADDIRVHPCLSVVKTYREAISVATVGATLVVACIRGCACRMSSGAVTVARSLVSPRGGGPCLTDVPEGGKPCLTAGERAHQGERNPRTGCVGQASPKGANRSKCTTLRCSSSVAAHVRPLRGHPSLLSHGEAFFILHSSFFILH